MAIRISKLKENINGKIVRYNQYQEAWARIDKGIEVGLYLEAITIEESIMNDRLNSYLKGSQKIDKNKDLRFSELIKKAISDNPKEELFKKVDEWRKQRNEAIHGIVKIEVSDIDTFLNKVEKCAVNGKGLAKKISAWVYKENPNNKPNASKS